MGKEMREIGKKGIREIGEKEKACWAIVMGRGSDVNQKSSLYNGRIIISHEV